MMMDRLQIDHEALALAIEVTRRESPARRQQVDAMLADQPWFDVGVFCSARAQSHSLNLPPWQPPPCSVSNIDAALAVTDEQRGWRAAALLLKKMLALNISRYAPNPLQAITEVEARRQSCLSP
jgi:hypothetical protein